MIVDCISDLHGYYPELEGGDLLIVAGDLTTKDTHHEYIKFYSWLHKQKYKHYIFIAGNHDNLLQEDKIISNSLANTSYLCDSGTEFEGLKIWGSPWTKTFEGMNPKCKAFTVDTEEELAEKWTLIPDDIDILVTHCPPSGILDKTIAGEHVGSLSLLKKIFKINPKLFVCGHIHECGYSKGTLTSINTTFVNASHVNEHYQPVNKPIRVVL